MYNLTGLYDAFADKRLQALRGRNSPSGWKIKYLLHLQECLSTVASQARLAVAQGSMLASRPAQQGLESALDCLDLHLADIQYLADEIDGLAEGIDSVQKLIKDQMDLAQSFWSTILGFVVAIYVPFSFASVGSPVHTEDSM